MATKKRTLGTAKRFGVRYGSTGKYKLAKIEEEYRKKPLLCPYCGKQKVKRVSYGIWECRKCLAKFTGKAYSIKKKIVFEEEKPAIVEEREVLEDEA
jgi:large subunit ribosomal protein L37Ae